jgi:hypothetical protein
MSQCCRIYATTDRIPQAEYLGKILYSWLAVTFFCQQDLDIIVIISCKPFRFSLFWSKIGQRKTCLLRIQPYWQNA